MAFRTSKPIKTIVTILLVSVLMLGIVSAQALAGPLGGTGYKIEGESNGLVISTPNSPENMGNLNPGDSKYSSLRLSNTGSNTLTVYMRTNIVGEETQNSGYLADVMKLTIKDRGTGGILVDKLFRAAAADGNVSIGSMNAGSEKTLDFYVDLPGEQTGNAYQGASMQVNWTFTTVYSGGNQDNNMDSNGSSRNKSHITAAAATTVPEGAIPQGEPVEPTEPVKPGTETPQETEEVVPETEVPEGIPVMPKTGESIPFMLYSVGLIAIASGIGLMLKKKP